MHEPKKQGVSLRFSKNFLWGASMSTHQVEGGNHNQWSVWELETAQLKASQAAHNYQHLACWQDIKDEASKPSNYVSGRASDHFVRYKTDFSLAKKMHLNTIRCGIEWSRIEPEEGVFNEAALRHYRQYLQTLIDDGFTPIVTLWHWTFPEWFARKGGFLKRSNIAYFTRYVRYIMENIQVAMPYVITINEPTVYTAMSYHQRRWPPQDGSIISSMRVLHNLGLAHRRAYTVIKKHAPRTKVGLAHNCAYFYAGDNSKISRLSAIIAHKLSNEYFINRVKKHQDFFGLNYYFANRIFGTKVHNPDGDHNDLGWSMQPEQLRPLINVLYKKYQKPVIVTESGVADREDQYRKWWIAQSIKSLSGAVADGSKVAGYIHWSLLDNFEWAEGFWPRFGLIQVDYKTQTRTIRPSARWYGSVIKKITEG